MEQALKEFSSVSSRKYTNMNGTPSYSYAAGAYESMMLSMFERLSKKDQQHFENLIKSMTNTLKGE